MVWRAVRPRRRDPQRRAPVGRWGSLDPRRGVNRQHSAVRAGRTRSNRPRRQRRARRIRANRFRYGLPDGGGQRHRAEAEKLVHRKPDKYLAPLSSTAPGPKPQTCRPISYGQRRADCFSLLERLRLNTARVVVAYATRFECSGLVKCVVANSKPKTHALG